MIRRFWLLAGKIVCLAVGLFLLLPFTASLLPDEKQPDLTALPDYNYMRDVWTMLRESKYQGAKELCADIIRNDLPGSEEAKAVAATVVGASGASAPTEKGVTLIFDRPFLYGIADLETGIPLFLGTFE